MVSNGGQMLTVTEKRILRSLLRNGEIRGVMALAHVSTGSYTAFQVDVLREYLGAAVRMVNIGHLGIERLPTTVAFKLTPTGMKLARSLESGSHARRPFAVAATSFGAAVAVAGCSVFTARSLDEERYVPDVLPTTQVAQAHNVGKDGTYWTYCDQECQGPTKKTIRLEEPIQARVQPKPVLVAPEAPKAVEQPKTISLSADVLFGFDSASATAEGINVLNELGAKLKSQRTITVEIVGYTDRLGSDEYNLRLSQKRADTVKAALSAYVDAELIKATGKGKANPVTEDQCSKKQARAKLVACLQPDRRVEINVHQRSA